MPDQQVYQINSEEVIVPPDRQRKIFSRDKMNELIDAIYELGQKTPGLCRSTPEGLELIFGERRLRACRHLKIPFKYILEEETDPYVLARIEFTENVAREDLDFKDKARAIAKFHEASQEQFGEAEAGKDIGHGVRDTAKAGGMSPTKVAEELELARFLEIPEVANAKNRTEARKTIKRIKEDYHTSNALEKAREEAGTDGRLASAITEESGEDSREAGFDAGRDEAADKLANKVSYFDALVSCGMMEEELEGFEEWHPDVVIFDPPWGVNLDKVRKTTGTTQDYKDSADWVFHQLPIWLAQLYEMMAENSHLYLFFGIVHHSRIYQLIEDIGFSTNRLPLIWYKQGAHVTRNPDIWPGRSYEPIAYARKGTKPLLRKGAPDVIITPAPWPSLKGSHPSAKHPDIYLDLLKRSCMPGDKVLDPMCGSGMMGVAAETMRVTHQLDWKMIEKEEEFTNLAIMNLCKGYSSLIQGSVTERREG